MAELENAVAETVETETEVETTTENPELAKLRSELAKQKAALDKATKEAAESKRALRAKQSAEEAAAEELKEAQEARDKELADLRKRFAVAETSKKVLSFVADEAVANEVAEYLYGAEDVDAALTAIQRAWTAKEKGLRLEYGKIPAPGTGNAEGPGITKDELTAMTYKQRMEFIRKYPGEYDRLMGRT